MKRKIPYYVLDIKNGNGRVLYNTLNNNKVRIPREHINSELEDLLIKKGFYVVTNEESNGQVEKRFNAKSCSYNITLIMTLDCNMNCTYCFENKSSKLTMDNETIDLIINRIENKIIYENKNKINVTFTGGEPLLAISQIKYFLNTYKQRIMNKYQIASAFSIITNGTLLSDSIFELFKGYHLRAIQITLDGVSKVHNELRPMIDGMDSYKQIINNINRYSREVQFVIRCNYEVGKENKLYQFIDEIAHEINDISMIKLKFRRIMNVHNTKCDYKYMINNDILSVVKYSKEKKIDVLLSSFCDNCRIYSGNSEYITPNGNIFRCYMFVDFEEYAIGNIREGIDGKSKDFFDQLKVYKECLGCKMISLCAGGCRYEALLAFGSIEQKVCNKKLEEIVKKYIEIKYL